MTIDSDLTSNRNPRTYVDPTPFEIASIAAQLSHGKDPEKYIRPAYNLYWAAFREAKRRDDEALESAHQESWDKENAQYLFFCTNTDSDPLRMYLHEKGLRLEKFETVRTNLRKFLNETGRLDEARAMKSDLRKQTCTKLLITTVDEFIRFKKGRKSDGGKKSHRTRQKRSTRTNSAKN